MKIQYIPYSSILPRVTLYTFIRKYNFLVMIKMMSKLTGHWCVLTCQQGAILGEVLEQTNRGCQGTNGTVLRQC